MMKSNATRLGLMAVLIGVGAMGCDPDVDDTEAREAILPVSVTDAEGNALLAGSFDPSTGEIYLVDSLLSAMAEPMQTIGQDQQAFVVVTDEAWHAGLSLDAGVMAGDQRWDADQSFMLVGMDGSEPHTSWHFQVMDRGWISSLTEDEAASRFPQCDTPDCGGCTILEEVVITPSQ